MINEELYMVDIRMIFSNLIQLYHRAKKDNNFRVRNNTVIQDYTNFNHINIIIKTPKIIL